MARTIGAKDRSRGRVRDETEDQRSARVAKTAETRKANKRKKDDAERAATAHRKSGFFEKRVRKSADHRTDGHDTNDGGAGDDSDDSGDDDAHGVKQARPSLSRTCFFTPE